jgi:hypothetical protein
MDGAGQTGRQAGRQGSRAAAGRHLPQGGGWQGPVARDAAEGGGAQLGEAAWRAVSILNFVTRTGVT